MSQFAAQPAPALIPEELLYGVDGADRDRDAERARSA